MRQMLRILAAFAVLNGWIAAAAAPFDFEIRMTGFALEAELADSPGIASVYRQRAYERVWTSGDSASNARLLALIDAVRAGPSHGLPFGEADVRQILALAGLPGTESNAARAEAGIGRIFIRFASSLSAGAVEPHSATGQIARRRLPPETAALFAGITASDPAAYIRDLAPRSHQYAMMRRELRRLDSVIKSEGWGETVNADRLELGDTGPETVKLRNRLVRMGYMKRASNRHFDSVMMFAVKRFQRDHGLDEDGIADPATIAAVNIEPEQRRRQVIAALERERWLNRPLGNEHVRVNIADFHADFISGGKPVFTTRVVVGKSGVKQQTPEFSDEMTHLVINPTWYVPRSIATEEILPKLKADPGAEPQLQMFTRDRGIIDRAGVDFREYSAQNFPYDFKQPPGPRNALGRVKFMFPNHFNVYMHDTPHRSLFMRETRNFSHGCIRLQKAEEFAHFLMERMLDKPKAEYAAIAALGAERTLMLPAPLPVHITYRTAFIGRDGRMQYRHDIYGRDQAVYEQLRRSGLLSGQRPAVSVASRGGRV